MIRWILSALFPPSPKSFHPADDMRSILGYHDRMQRAAGEDYTFERVNFTIGQRVGKVVEGQYVDVSEHANSRLHYSDDERQIVAIYPVNIAPEPTPEEVSVEALEAVYTQDDRELAALVSVLVKNG